MTHKIAHWCSKGARWEAVLERNDNGFRLSERKHGHEVGAAYRPLTYFLGRDDFAKTYFQKYVVQSFDVEMKRVA